MGYSVDYSLVSMAGFYFLVFNQLVGKIDPWTDAGRVNYSDMAFAIVAFFCASTAYS